MRPYSFSNLILLSFTYLLSSACCESDLRKFRDFIKDISNLKLTAKMTINKEIVLKNKNLPNLNCNTSHENHSRKPNKTHVKLNTMNLSFHNNPKSRCGSSMDQNNECTLLETPSVKNVLSNENFNYDRNNNHDRCAFPPPFFDSMFSTKETIFNTSFTQPQSPVDFNKDLARASMKNKCNLSLFDVPLKNTPVKAKTNSIRIKKINTQSMEKEQRRNISEIPTVQEPQELRKSLNLPQTNCNFLEVPVYYCNLKSEIKKLKKENWKLKQENTDLTRKLAKFDEIQSKCNRLELNQKTDFESLVKDLSPKSDLN